MADTGEIMAQRIVDATGSKAIITDEDKVLISPLVSKVNGFFQEAVNNRLTWESQAIRNLMSYRGEFTNKFRQSEDENKRVFIRTTTVKTRAAYAQIMEALLANSRFPIMAESTPDPSGVPMYAHIKSEADGETGEEDTEEETLTGGVGFPGDGKQLNPGATSNNMSFVDDESFEFKGADLVEGVDKTGQGVMISPAKRAAEVMDRIIQDQLLECNASTELRKAVFEACLTGSGVLKGVFTEQKIQHTWKDGVYSPVTVETPKVQFASIWDIYIDPNALVAKDAEWVIERHRLTRKQLLDMKIMPNFDAKAIQKCIEQGANYNTQGFENQVRELDTIPDKSRLWEALEYWGYLSTEEALEAGLEVPADVPGSQVQVNMWICGDNVLRLIVNPFLPKRIPYFVFNYEQNPYNALGTGVPETMQDSQSMINGFATLAVENLALAGNVILEVDDTLIQPGQNYDLFPGKVFKKVGGSPGMQAIRSVDIKSTAQENMLLMREFRQLADESTGIPSVSHGQTGVTGVGRTSSGLSTILEAASLNIKTVIRNIDDDVLQPLGKMLFYWNNQFNYKNLPQGDFDVVATGTTSYTKQEVKAQRIQTFIALSANPALAPIINITTLLRELAKANDMDPNEIINDSTQAAIYADIIGKTGGLLQNRGAEQAQSPGEPGGPGNPGGQGTGAGNQGGVGNEAGANAQSAGSGVAPGNGGSV